VSQIRRHHSEKISALKISDLKSSKARLLTKQYHPDRGLCYYPRLAHISSFIRQNLTKKIRDSLLQQ